MPRWNPSSTGCSTDASRGSRSSNGGNRRASSAPASSAPTGAPRSAATRSATGSSCDRPGRRSLTAEPLGAFSGVPDDLANLLALDRHDVTGRSLNTVDDLLRGILGLEHGNRYAAIAADVH